MVDKITVKDFALKMKKKDLRSVEDQIEKLEFKLKLLKDCEGKNRKQNKINAFPVLIRQLKTLLEQYKKEIAELEV